jgi:hypothetical protein
MATLSFFHATRVLNTAFCSKLSRSRSLMSVLGPSMDSLCYPLLQTLLPSLAPDLRPSTETTGSDQWLPPAIENDTPVGLSSTWLMLILGSLGRANDRTLPSWCPSLWPLNRSCLSGRTNSVQTQERDLNRPHAPYCERPIRSLCPLQHFL